MNGFALHHITHISASSVNAFAAEPALWVMERLMKLSAPVGCAAHRGAAIEDGVTAGLLDPSLPIGAAQKIALETYDRRSSLSADSNREKERDAVAPAVAIALAELRQYGVPDLVQKRVEVQLPDIPVPLIGFLDYGWSTTGTVLDLKTSLKLASEISGAHARQVAGYVHGTNHQARVCYTTPKKLAVYVLEDPSARINEVVQIAMRMNRFLSISADPAELAALMVPNYDNYFWNSPIARAHGKQLYGW